MLSKGMRLKRSCDLNLLELEAEAPPPHFEFASQKSATESNCQDEKSAPAKRSLAAPESAHSRLKKRKIVHTLMSSALLHPNRKTSNDASLPLLPHTTFQKRPSRMAPGDSCWTGDDSSWTSTVYTAFNQMCVSKPTRPIVKRASMPYEPTLQEEDQVDRLLTRASRSNSAPPLRLDVHQGGSDQYLLNSQMIHMLRMQLGAGQGDSSLKMRKFVAWRAHCHQYLHSSMAQAPASTIPQASTSSQPQLPLVEPNISPSDERSDLFGEVFELDSDDDDLDDLILDDFLEDHNYLSEFAPSQTSEPSDIIPTAFQMDLPPRPILRHAATHPLAKKASLYHQASNRLSTYSPLVY